MNYVTVRRHEIPLTDMGNHIRLEWHRMKLELLWSLIGLLSRF